MGDFLAGKGEVKTKACDCEASELYDLLMDEHVALQACYEDLDKKYDARSTEFYALQELYEKERRNS